MAHFGASAANAAATFMGLKIPTTKDLGGKRFTAYFTCEEPSCIVCRSGMSVDFPLGVQNVHPLVECICGKPMRLQDYDCVEDSDDEPADDGSDQMGSDDELCVASVTCMLFRCPVCFHTRLDTYTEHDTMMPHIPPLCCSTTCINAMRTGSRRRRLDFAKVAPRVATLVYGIVGTQQSGSADVDMQAAAEQGWLHIPTLSAAGEMVEDTVDDHDEQQPGIEGPNERVLPVRDESPVLPFTLD